MARVFFLNAPYPPFTVVSPRSPAVPRLGSFGFAVCKVHGVRGEDWSSARYFSIEPLLRELAVLFWLGGGTGPDNGEFRGGASRRRRHRYRTPKHHGDEKHQANIGYVRGARGSTTSRVYGKVRKRVGVAEFSLKDQLLGAAVQLLAQRLPVSPHTNTNPQRPPFAHPIGRPIDSHLEL